MKKTVSILIILIMLLAYIPAFAAGTAKPDKVTGISAANTGVNEITVSWDPVDDAYGYHVYKKVNGDWKWLKSVKKTSFADPDVKWGSTYIYTVCVYSRVNGKNIKGEWNSKGASCKAEFAEVPGISAKNTGVTEITVSWKPVTGAKGYHVYKKINGKWKWQKSVKGTSWADANVTWGSTYNYTVRAYASVNGKDVKGEWNSKGASCKAEFAAVSGFKAENTAILEMTVSWNAVKGASAYDVYKKVNGKWKWLKATSDTKYVDKNAALYSTHSYAVRPYTKINGKKVRGGWNGKGASCYSDFGMADDINIKSATLHGITVQWSAVKGASGYDVYIKAGSGKWKWQKATKGTEFIHINAELGTKYSYTVRPYTYIGGKKIQSKWNSKGVAVVHELDGIVFDGKMAVPVLKSATVKGDETIVVKWGAVSKASGYYVYRKAPGEEWKYIQAVSGTVFTDMNAERDVTYSYTVRAYKKSGEKVVVGKYDNEGVSAKVPYKAHFHQGSTSWGFSRALRKRACVLCSTAMLLRNNGEETNPRLMYDANGKVSSMAFPKALKFYGRKYVRAIPINSKYYDGYEASSGYTYVKSPAKNAVAAIKEALDRNPEGVMCYFVKGSRRHAVVAIRYDGNQIFYSDPGRVRSKGYDVPWDETWCYRGHKMSYKHLRFIVAID